MTIITGRRNDIFNNEMIFLHQKYILDLILKDRFFKILNTFSLKNFFYTMCFPLFPQKQ